MATVVTGKFRIERLRRGWTQDDLAKQCTAMGAPVDESHISRIERGEYAPRPKLRAVLSELLSLDVTDFERRAS